MVGPENVRKGSCSSSASEPAASPRPSVSRRVGRQPGVRRSHSGPTTTSPSGPLMRRRSPSPVTRTAVRPPAPGRTAHPRPGRETIPSLAGTHRAKRMRAPAAPATARADRCPSVLRTESSSWGAPRSSRSADDSQVPVPGAIRTPSTAPGARAWARSRRSQASWTDSGRSPSCPFACSALRSSRARSSRSRRLRSALSSSSMTSPSPPPRTSPRRPVSEMPWKTDRPAGVLSVGPTRTPPAHGYGPRFRALCASG